MSLLKLLQNNLKIVKFDCNHKLVFITSSRKLSLIPSVYDNADPGPKFFSKDVQLLLERLTRPDFKVVFRKRTNLKIPKVHTPKYKFLTDDQLREERTKVCRKAAWLLQMPPVVKVCEPISEVVSRDPALACYDDATYLFTDITFGVKNEERLIVQRERDGTLRKCDHDIRKRLNQIYFPIEGRYTKDPAIFSDEECFNRMLKEETPYEYLLDRACIQYEPYEHQFQRITSIIYQHIDMKNLHHLLRSTRHFGPMVFYLTWHNSMDKLLVEIVQSGIIREAVLLIVLRQHILEDLKFEIDTTIVPVILKTEVQLLKPDDVSESDIDLDGRCLAIVEEYLGKNSTMKTELELALQGFREYYLPIADRSRGLRQAHGQY